MTTTKTPHLPNGYPVGTCEQALDTACGLYLNDPNRLDLNIDACIGLAR